MYYRQEPFSTQFVGAFVPQTQFPASRRDPRTLHGANIRRLMAQLDMSFEDLVSATGLDQRTLRCILRGTTRPHTRTLYKLAHGLGVEADELFQDPLTAGHAAFDRATNPHVAEAIDNHPELFDEWNLADFDELFSRMGVGGELTEEGALQAAREMNARRELLFQVSVILESREGDLMRDFIELLYRRATEFGDDTVSGLRECKSCKGKSDL